MKLLVPLLAVAGLTGCVGYVPYGSAGAYYDNGAQYSPYYGYGYGGTPYYSAPYYGTPFYGSVYYGRSTPYVVEQRRNYIPPGGNPRSLRRDRDGDGVADRLDRDRDGDGVPNRRDPFPGDSRRR